tara:strand:- start:2494 stop:3795 length:1302 start_codon:yes stop_codon:yes gene_type:complete
LREALKKRIVHQLYWLVLFFPIWWFLGVEQFFWFISVSLVFIQFVIYSKFQFHLSIVSVLLLLFLFVYGISFFSIEEKVRYITYFRNLSTYITAFMLLTMLWNVVEKWHQIEKILNGIVFVMLFASVVGLLAFSFEIFRFQFKSLTGYFLPDFIAKTGYGSVIAIRNVGYYNWFLGINTYFRPSSFFLYSTMFSSTLAIVLPIAILLRDIHVGFRRWYYSIVVLIMILALIATTGRVAILAFFIGYILFRIISVRNIKIKSLIFLLGSTVILVLLFILERSGILYQIIDLVLYSRGEGSTNTRIDIYIQTFNSFLERPFFGWGTERDVNGLAYPLGSHSYYLGTLYKQGIIGLTVFLLLFISIWKCLKVRIFIDNNFTRFLKYGQFLMIVYFLNSFTDVLDLDATTMMFSWLIISLLIVGKRIYMNNLIKKDA